MGIALDVVLIVLLSVSITLDLKLLGRLQQAAPAAEDDEPWR